MALYKAKFKSVEIIITKESTPPKSRIQGEILVTTYGIDKARDHELVLGIKDFIATSAWIGSFFFTFMIVGFAMALIYGGLVVGGMVNLKRESFTAAENSFIILSCAVYLLVWTGFTARSVIRKSKKSLVEKDRGKGNWKLLDEKKWPVFVRILELQKKRKEAKPKSS